jgi:hypothetical protein
MWCTRWRRALGLAGCALALGSPRSGIAQSITQPAQAWRTLTTEHFVFHTPARLEAWARHVASRMESYAAAVSAFVGNSPKGRVTVLVDDPAGNANGFAVPLLGEPVIMMWPTPPTPSIGFGEFREWGEILAVHEFAHIAHLTYPSRNPLERFWWSFLPARVGPVARRTPPWVFEGFATLVEGRLTGDGRPHSAGRAAVLRQWALAGKLPPYSALDNADSFMGGAMRYLVGSAYLEWLVERKGDASLEHVWRRLSARTPRSFAQAFAGVYGTTPDDLYGQFVVDVTARALRARDIARSHEPSEGELFQHIEGNTGEPAGSPDGKHVAVALRRIGQPSRLVIWRADSAGIDSAIFRQRARILSRDPQDVAPFDSFPLPRRTVATLRAVAGAGYNNPRWLPNGSELLVSREVSLGNGYWRPDLFVWNWKTGRVRRVTHGAGIRFADPSPDGRRAVGSRCDAGVCGLVMVDLRTGAWHPLVAGTPTVSWHRPRWSYHQPRIAASVHRNGQWEVAVVDTAGEDLHFVAPNDSTSRHSPVWSGFRLIVVSELGGIPHLELLDSAGYFHVVTRTLGANVSPDHHELGGAVWYLDLHPKGYDVRRYFGAVKPTPDTLQLPRTLAPVAPMLARPARTFDSAAVSARNYGLGPRNWRYFPGFAAGADGAYGLLAITNYDPAGKLGILAQGAYGQRRVWRGGSLGAAWRGWPAFDVVASGFTTQFGAPRGSSNPRFDGAALSIGRALEYGAAAWSWQIGANAGRVELSDSNAFHRTQAYTELGFTRRQSSGFWRSLSLRLHGSAGETGTADVRRAVASLGVTTAIGGLRLRLAASGGRVSLDPDSSAAGPAGGFETFQIGGLAPPLFDARVLPQRISVPALPGGSAAGRAFVSYRTTLSAPGLPASLYAAWFRVYDPNGDWNRLIGVEGEQGFASIGFASLPNVSLQYGAAYSMDDPRRHRWTLYAGARFAP